MPIEETEKKKSDKKSEPDHSEIDKKLDSIKKQDEKKGKVKRIHFGRKSEDKTKEKKAQPLIEIKPEETPTVKTSSEKNKEMKENNHEKAKKLIELMIKENLRGFPILVEGRTDKKALKGLGVKGEIFIIQGTGNRLYTIAEKISNQSKRAIILTDPDHEGSRIAGQISDILESGGVTPDLRFRRICNLLKVSQVAHLKPDFD